MSLACTLNVGARQAGHKHSGIAVFVDDGNPSVIVAGAVFGHPDIAVGIHFDTDQAGVETLRHDFGRGLCLERKNTGNKGKSKEK